MQQQGDIWVSPWFEALLAKYGPPLLASVLGVSIGTAAKYGLTMSEGRTVKRSEVISDLLLIPFMCLISGTATAEMGLTGLWATTLAAFLGISSYRAVEIVRRRFLERLASEVALLDQHKGEVRQLSQIELSKANIAAEGLNAPTAGNQLVRELPASSTPTE